jgi:dTMP kinase
MKTTGLRGALIVIEGCDGAGKSTQAKMLVDYLTQCKQATELREYPSMIKKAVLSPFSILMKSLSDRRTPIGQMIHSYLKKQLDIEDRAIHLLFSANRWESA